MSTDSLIYGLLDNSGDIGDACVARKLRELTICWSRYSFHGTIIEGRSHDQILCEAHKWGARYCFIQAFGHILWESWDPFGDPLTDIVAALLLWARNHEFLAAGRVTGDPVTWFGFAGNCLLVDLHRHRRLGWPRFDWPEEGRVELPRPIPVTESDDLVELRPSFGTDWVCPQQRGWHLIAASLSAGVSVQRLDPTLLGCMSSLVPPSPSQIHAFTRFLGSGIQVYGPDESFPDLTEDQHRLLRAVAEQTGAAQRGVGLWNIESYADVEIPLDLSGPISSLYSVAQGFKSNRILQRQGFDEHTRVCFFDYSQRALDVKRRMIERWNGEDFPRFVRYLFEAFPPCSTYYCLWSGATPDNITDDQLRAMWRQELDNWGGEREFRDHWRRFCELEHHFLCCNILTEPEKLIRRVHHEDNAVIWWSNAFFTFYSNWYYTNEQRQQMYERWIGGLMERNPALNLYGSDHNNSSVNKLQAADYWTRYRGQPVNSLSACSLNALQIRM